MQFKKKVVLNRFERVKWIRRKSMLQNIGECENNCELCGTREVVQNKFTGARAWITDHESRKRLERKFENQCIGEW